VLIKASGNVTSVVKNAAGDYTVNFTTAMEDANYVTLFITSQNVARAKEYMKAPNAVGSVDVALITETGNVDTSWGQVAVFR
jgi:hypothetical protein